MSTPMFEHYKKIKAKYEDCIVFYRLGDFYEMFSDDAILGSRLLELTLTHRADEAMCGVPFHAADFYIAKLVNMGYKVAICEQLTEPKPGTIVERDVVRVITPGTAIEDTILDENKNNYLLCLYKGENDMAACYIDVSTGEFKAQIIKAEQAELEDVLSRVSPKEIIGNIDSKSLYESLKSHNIAEYPRFDTFYDWAFTLDRANKNLKAVLGDNYKKVFDLEGKKEVIIAAGAVLEYLNSNQKKILKNISKITLIEKGEFLTIDANSRRNLELCESIRERKKYGSLLWLLDQTKTAMGGRFLRKMFDEPFRDAKKINKRLGYVEELVKNIILRDKLSNLLASVYDIERLSAKLAMGSITPKELLSLKRSLFVLPEIKSELLSAQKLQDFAGGIGDFKAEYDLIDRAINPDAPALLKDGNYIKDGFNDQLDSFRTLYRNTSVYKDQLEATEREKTGIASLKIGYNRVFGYYIEVNKKDSLKVPITYERRQTVSNNERYITPELKNLEREILSASENAIKLEGVLYQAVKDKLLESVTKFLSSASVIAELDAILSLALSAVKYNFVKPSVTLNAGQIKIIGGRHPVVENFLKDSSFIANDTTLDNNENRVMLITGPNMAGKSTYMRQVALIVFMAHIGSFVPATSAEISVCDRIFTRVGASDDLAFGQSTFMVEMSEVANILANATQNSLILLDEIGRGTSTFDGLSIAWAVVENICKNRLGKTLFATHYHELTELEGVLDGVKNYKVAVKEYDDNVVFLHKIVRGGANKSFGIEVARLAGVNKDVLTRATEISKNLEKVNQKLDSNIFKEQKTKAEENTKLAQEVLRIVKDIDVNRISPMAAFDILVELSKKVKEGEQ